MFYIQLFLMNQLNCVMSVLFSVTINSYLQKYAVMSHPCILLLPANIKLTIMKF